MILGAALFSAAGFRIKLRGDAILRESTADAIACRGDALQYVYVRTNTRDSYTSSRCLVKPTRKEKLERKDTAPPRETE